MILAKGRSSRNPQHALFRASGLFLEACTVGWSIPHHFENVYGSMTNCQNSRMRAWNSATQRSGSYRQTHRSRSVGERLAFDFCFISSGNGAKPPKSGSLWFTLGTPGFCGSARAHMIPLLFQTDVILETGSHPDLATHFLPVRRSFGALRSSHIYLCFRLLNAESTPWSFYPSTVLSFLDKELMKSRWVMSYVVNNIDLSLSLSSWIIYSQSLGRIINW